MAELYAITGVMAAGKSTVAELLAQRFEKGVHLRGDVFRRMIVSGREEMCAEPSMEAVRQLHLRYRLAVTAPTRILRQAFPSFCRTTIMARNGQICWSAFPAIPCAPWCYARMRKLCASGKRRAAKKATRALP